MISSAGFFMNFYNFSYKKGGIATLTFKQNLGRVTKKPR